MQQCIIAHQLWPMELAKPRIWITKQKIIDNTTDTFSTPSTSSYSYGKLNENTDITSKK